MCGLCGILTEAAEWSDTLVTGDADGDPPPPWLRRRMRRVRSETANRILRHYGLNLSDWQGSVFLLRASTGAVVEVAGLRDLWGKAAALAARDIDPLDTSLLARVNADRR